MQTAFYSYSSNPRTCALTAEAAGRIVSDKEVKKLAREEDNATQKEETDDFELAKLAPRIIFILANIF